jgi:trypsin
MTHLPQNLLPAFAHLSLLFSLSGCGTKTSQSSLQITNGKEINETRYQSVIFIRASAGGHLQSCTATFVNHYQAVTAAHCLEGMTADDPAVYAAKFDVNGKEITSFGAEDFKIHPLYDSTVSPNPHDLAVIDFPRHSASTIALIASKAPAIDSWVQLVGYGDNENFYDAEGHLSGSGSNKKRVGTNKVYAYDKDMILIVGVPGTTQDVMQGTESCSGAGDSGGPLFINSSTLVGVTFGGGIHKETAEDGSTKLSCGSYYVDLSRKENIDFLESVLTYGIKMESDSETAR